MDDNYVDEYIVARSAESYGRELFFLSNFLELVTEIAMGKCVRECPSCGGAGDVYNGREREAVTCEVCGGSGKVAWAITCSPYDPNKSVPEVDLDDIPF